MKRILLITGLMILTLARGYAQRKSLRDSSYSLPIIGLHVSGEMPAADMAHRFGNSMSVGMPFLYKTSSSWIFGLEGNYFFGARIKEQSMKNLVNSDGTITDVNGNPATFRLNERGWSTYAIFGRVFNKLGHNKNSGVMGWVGLGYLTHKVNIYDVGRTLPQIHGDLAKGYDKLTGGIATSQFIGYLFMSQNRITNFYAGFEFQEAFTKGLRGYQYDTGTTDGQSRLDILCGIRFGWLLPLYKKAPRDFYYY